MKKTLMASMVALPLLTGGAYAEGLYAGAEYTRLTVNSSDPALDAILFTGGFSFNDWFSLEGRLGKSEKEKDDGASLEIDNMYGVYAKFNGRNKISPVSPYLMVGYTRAKISLIDEGDDLGDTISDISYGLGIDFSISENLYIDLEGVNYIVMV
jgi:opacity protein-like surface antigen